MKLKRSLGVIGACAIVSASVVAPSFYYLLSNFNSLPSYAYLSPDILDNTLDNLGKGMSLLDGFYYDQLHSKGAYFSVQFRRISRNWKFENTSDQRYTMVLNVSKSTGNSITGKCYYVIENLTDGSIQHGYYDSISVYFDLSTYGVRVPQFQSGSGYMPCRQTEDKTLRLDEYVENAILPLMSYHSDTDTYDYNMEKPVFNQFALSKDGLMLNDAEGMWQGYEKTVEKYSPKPTEPPNTTPAPGFPNLPDNWVNPSIDFDIDFDIPTLDVNLELPEYTLPEKPEIPEEYGNLLLKFLNTANDILVRTNLIWVVALSLFLTLILFILR